MRLLPFLTSLLAASCLAAEAGTTNLFALHLVDGEIPWQAIADATTKPQDYRWLAEPILSDRDLLGYNPTIHAVTVSRPTAQRLADLCARKLQVPFLLKVRGEPIYVGAFTTGFSSQSSGVPSILREELQFGAPVNLAPTNSIQVTFIIHGGYPGEQGVGKDPRADKRILSALDALFAQRANPEPALRVPHADHPRS